MSARRALLAAAIGVAACDGSARRPDAPATPVAATPEQFRRGEAVYQSFCAGCHGDRIQGTPQAPPLTEPRFLAPALDERAFEAALRNGKAALDPTTPPMPAFPMLSADEVAHVRGYVRWRQKEETAAAGPAPAPGP